MARERREADVPYATLLWTPAALMVWGGVVVLALVFWVTAWYNVAGKANWNDQVLGMNIAIASLVVAMAASIGLLLAGRRAIGLRRIALLGQASDDYVPASQVVDTSVQGAASSAVLVGEVGRTHYHRSDCAMAAERNWPEGSELEFQRAGMTPCGVCRP